MVAFIDGLVPILRGDMVSRNQIVEQARSYLGVPFVHQGRSRRGLDCVGLVIRVAKDFELSNYQEIAYDRRPDGRLISVLREHLVRKFPSDAFLPGDVVAFRLPKYPCHVAIYSGNGRIIHALAGNRKVVEHVIDQRWWDRVVEKYSIPGVEN